MITDECYFIIYSIYNCSCGCLFHNLSRGYYQAQEQGEYGSWKFQSASEVNVILNDTIVLFTFWTLASVCIFTILFSVHLIRCWKGYFFLITKSFLRWRRIRYWSLLGIKVLIHKVKNVVGTEQWLFTSVWICSESTNSEQSEYHTELKYLEMIFSLSHNRQLTLHS